MKKLFLSCLILFLTSCNQKGCTKSSSAPLAKENKVEKDTLIESFSENMTILGNGYTFTVFTDSTYTESFWDYTPNQDNPYVFSMDSLVINTERLVIKNDTLLFDDKIGLLKNGYLEIIKSDITIDRLKVRKSKIEIPYYFDTQIFPKYHQFFGSQSEKYIFKNYAPYQKINLNTKQVETLDSLFVQIFKNNSDFKYLDFDSYYIQFLPTLSKDREIIIECMLSCTEDMIKYSFLDLNDGGNCYIEMSVNLNKNKITNYYIHGL